MGLRHTNEPTIRETGALLARAVSLKARPICVYGSGSVPKNGVDSASISACVASAMYGVASGKIRKPLYVVYTPGRSFCRCLGGPAWFGYEPFNPALYGLMSGGSKEMKNSAAKYLKENEKAACDTFMSAGKITSPGKYVVASACEDVISDPGVKCIVCFGTAEQVRELCALAHFRRHSAFSVISVPWGPSCATLVTYPAGMAENVPDSQLYAGPVDSSAREWLPEGFMGLGIPANVAKQMAEDTGRSFISQRCMPDTKR